jgi:hypothetical protein
VTFAFGIMAIIAAFLILTLRENMRELLHIKEKEITLVGRRLDLQERQLKIDEAYALGTSNQKEPEEGDSIGDDLDNAEEFAQQMADFAISVTGVPDE